MGGRIGRPAMLPRRAACAAALAGVLASGTPVPPCYEADMAYEDGARTSQLPNAGFWHAPEYCQKACKDQGYYCSYWTWQQHGDNAKGIAPGACWALKETAVLRKQVGSVAGPQTCPMSTISTSPSVLGAGSGSSGSGFIHTGAPTPSPAQPSGGVMPISGSGGGSLVNGATTRKPALAGATAGSMAGTAAGGVAAGSSAAAGSTAGGGSLPEGEVPEGAVITDAPPATSPPALPEGESSATAAPTVPPPPASTTPEATAPPATSAAPQEEVMTTLIPAPTIVTSTSALASSRVWTGIGMIDSVCNFFADWFNWFSEVTGLSWWTMAFLTAFLCTFLALVAFCKHMHDSRKDKRKKKRSLHQHAMAEDEEMQDMEDYGRSDPETYEEVTRPLINYQEAGRPIGGPAGPGALPTLHPPLPPGYPQPTFSRPQSQRRPQPTVSPMASPRAGPWRGLAPVPTTAVTTAAPAPVVQRPGAMALPLVQQITVRFPQRLRFF